jgi:DUF4097 and DUF4098 domain-containing protein YvlB
MNRNKKLFAMIVLAAICLPFVYGGCGGGGGSSNDGQVFVEEPFFFEVTANQHVLLRLQGINGSVEITGSPTADSVTVEGERRVGSDSRADAENHLDDLEVEVTDLDTEVFIETVQPRRAGGRNYIVDYRITIPDNLQVLVNHVNGNVFVDAIDSQVNVNNVNGEIELSEIFGSTRANLVNGKIISQVTLPGAGIVELSTVNGGVDTEITLQADGTIDITALIGSIHLDIPQNTSATFAAGVVDGTIKLLNLELKNEVRTRNKLTGELGNGTGDILLETEIGNITVTGF